MTQQTFTLAEIAERLNNEYVNDMAGGSALAGLFSIGQLARVFGLECSNDKPIPFTVPPRRREHDVQTL